MSPVLTSPAPASVRRLRDVAVPLAALVVFAALFAGVLRLVEPAATIDAVTVDNRTSQSVEVGGSAGGRGPELPLTALDPDASTRVEDVLDQGPRRTFRVGRAGERIGTLERSRERLRADGWRVVVPASWDDRIAATG